MTRFRFLTLIACLFLTACGQYGGLRLPEQTPPEKHA